MLDRSGGRCSPCAEITPSASDCAELGGATILGCKLMVVKQSTMASSTLQRRPITSRAAIVVGIVTLALIAVRVPSGRASGWNAKEICASHACRTIVADARVRVFRATDRRGYDIVFAEWLPTHQAREIDFPRSEPLTAVELAGSVFAYAVRYRSGRAVFVYVEDLQPGRAAEGGSWVAAENMEAGSAGVRNLAVTASGSVAWLVEGRFMDPTNREAGPYRNSRAIFCAIGTGEPVLLAYGPTISPSALRVDASRCAARRAS
jgi:hypothetical protein